MKIFKSVTSLLLSFILTLQIVNITMVYANSDTVDSDMLLEAADDLSSGEAVEVDNIVNVEDFESLSEFDNMQPSEQNLYGNTNYNILNGGCFVLNGDILFYSYDSKIIKEDENSVDEIVSGVDGFLNIYENRLFYVSGDKIFSVNFDGEDMVEEFCSDGIFINNFIIYNNIMYLLLGNDIYYIKSGELNKIDMDFEVHSFTVANDGEIFAAVFSNDCSHDYISDLLIEYNITNCQHNIISKNVGYYDSNLDFAVYNDLDDGIIYKYVINEKAAYPLILQDSVTGINISESLKIYFENQPYLYDETNGLIPAELTPYDNIGTSFYSTQGGNIVSVAAAEIGTSGRPNKYTYWYGSISGSYAYEWCQTFASWCANQAGLSSYYPKTASCDVGKDWFIKHSVARYEVSQAFGGTYEPQPGDFIYFSNDHTQADSTHVGIVERVDSSNVYTIEGNYSNRVAKVTRKKNNNGYIIGYGVPEFNLVSGNNPQGAFDTAKGGTGYVNVTGWAFDKDDTSKALAVHVYIGGPAGVGEGYPITANTTRTDVNNVYGCGNNHGFEAKIPTKKTGTQSIYVYAINIGNGETTLLGTKTVSISKDSIAPKISNVKVSQSSTGYTVTCTATDSGSGVDRVQFPTWTTNNGQDDIFASWETNSKASGTRSGDTFTYTVKYSGHNNEKGEYNTHIYAYDFSGNQVSYSLKVVPTTAPSGYSISVDKNSTYVYNNDSSNQVTVYCTVSNGVSCTAKLIVEKSGSVYGTYDFGSGKSFTNTIAFVETGTYEIYFELTNAGGSFKGAKGNGSQTISVTEKPKYTVSYNANGGSGAPSSQTKLYGKSLTLSSTKPTRTGYTFSKWNTKADGSGTSYSSGGTYTANSGVTLYAIWIPITYTVSYNANGGSGAPSSQTKTYGKSLTLSSTKPARTGYTFSKWNTKADGSGTSYSSGGTYTANSNVTLYAIWTTSNTYTITYNSNGGTGTPPTQIVVADTTGNFITKLSSTKPTRAGCTFVNWNTKSDGTGTSYNPGEAYTPKESGSVTLYAIWAADNKLMLNVAGGSGVAGGYVDVPVKISNNNGIATYTIAITYDNSIMYPVSYTKGNNFSDMISTLDSGLDLSQQKEVKFVWDSLNDVSGDYTVFTVKFKIKDTVESGNYSLGVNQSNTMFANSSLSDIYYNILVNNIVVGSILKGDVNNDGIVNGKDVILLRQYIAGFPNAKLDEEQFAAGDVTGDSIVNGKDVIKIRQHLAGFPGIKL